jgi:hypothetical protein
MPSVSTLFQNPLIIALMSAVVSGVVATTFESIYGYRIKHNFEKRLQELRYAHKAELERLRITLQIESEEQKEVRLRRHALYPHIVETTYRIRNMVREILILANTAPDAQTDLLGNAQYLSADLAT